MSGPLKSIKMDKDQSSSSTLILMNEFRSIKSSDTESDFEIDQESDISLPQTTHKPTSELEEKGRITKLESELCAVVLEDCRHQLVILGASRPPAYPELHYTKLSERYGLGDVKDNIFDPETNKLIKNTTEERGWTKLQKDRALALQVIQAVKQELKDYHTMVTLTEFIAAEKRVAEEEEALETSYIKNHDDLSNIKINQFQNQKEMDQLIKQRSEEITSLEEQLQETMFKSGIEMAYARHWERSRVEQNTMLYEEKEEEIKKRISVCEDRMKKIDRVKKELKAFITQNMQELDLQITELTEKYTREMEERDVAINNLKYTKAAERAKLEKLQKEFEERQNAMDRYIEERTQRQILADEARDREYKATKIQAWWRGVMVRRHLGPYKKLKKEPEKKKKKK